MAYHRQDGEPLYRRYLTGRVRAVNPLKRFPFHTGADLEEGVCVEFGFDPTSFEFGEDEGEVVEAGLHGLPCVAAVS